MPSLEGQEHLEHMQWHNFEKNTNKRQMYRSQSTQALLSYK